MRLGQMDIGHICAPMLFLVSTGTKLPVLAGVQGLLFTSANGVRAFCEASTLRGFTAWCVGPATLRAAEDAGFLDLQHGDGNGDDLAALVIEKARPEAGRFLHIANSAAAGNIAQTLRKAGFAVDFAPLYAAQEAQSVPVEVLNALKEGTPCFVLVHSAKGAASFGKAASGLDLSPHILVAVSEAAAAPLAPRGFAKTFCAERPNEAALLEALDKAQATL